MAYMSQEHKKELVPGIKRVLKKYNLKASVSVRNHTKLIVSITSGPEYLADLLGDNHFGDMSVNHYYITEMYPEAAKPLLELRDAMNAGNHDRSNGMIDYFDVGWYIGIEVGKPNRFFKVV